MANDHAKNPGPVAQEHSYPPAVPPYAQPLGAAYPPGYPIYYAQPPDSNHGENASGVPQGTPYMFPFPAAPGMMYPYPPPPPGQGFPQYPQSPPAAANGPRPKRKQVKMACTNCANACKRCDEARPCERCVKYGIQESCVDGVRKERQKGIKRGPYKRKNKGTNSNSTEASFVAENGESEWQATSGTPQASAGGQPPPPIQAIPHYPPPPEGFYPYFYPPPPGFMPPGHEGQSPDGAANSASHPHPMVPYYPMAPPGFFPYASVPPGAFPPPPNGTSVTTIDPAEASKNGQSAVTEKQTNGTTTSGKKRSRSGKGDVKIKKYKSAPIVQDSPTSGGTATAAGSSDRASDAGANTPPEHDD